MSTLDDVISEIDAAIRRDTTRTPGEVTISEYAGKHLGMSYGQARTELHRGVRNGVLSVRQILENGKTVNVYRMAGVA